MIREQLPSQVAVSGAYDPLDRDTFVFNEQWNDVGRVEGGVEISRIRGDEAGNFYIDIGLNQRLNRTHDYGDWVPNVQADVYVNGEWVGDTDALSGSLINGTDHYVQSTYKTSEIEPGDEVRLEIPSPRENKWWADEDREQFPDTLLEKQAVLTATAPTPLLQSNINVTCTTGSMEVTQGETFTASAVLNNNSSFEAVVDIEWWLKSEHRDPEASQSVTVAAQTGRDVVADLSLDKSPGDYDLEVRVVDVQWAGGSVNPGLR